METHVRAHFDGHVFVPERPVSLAAGTIVEIPLPTVPVTADVAPLAALVETLDQFPSDPNWPADMATQHDHYLYGAPKRQ